MYYKIKTVIILFFMVMGSAASQAEKKSDLELPAPTDNKEQKEKHEENTENKNLSVSIKISQVVKFGEFLKFTVSSNKNCELNIIYIQADKKRIVLPQKIKGLDFVGNPLLKKGETRTVPVNRKACFEFRPPAGKERLVIQCGVGSLGNKKITQYDLDNNTEKASKRGGFLGTIKDNKLLFKEVIFFTVKPNPGFKKKCQ